MRETGQLIETMSQAQLRDIAANHRCPYRRFHAARYLGSAHGFSTANPFDRFTSADLRRALRVTERFSFLSQAIESELNFRRSEEHRQHGNFKSSVGAKFLD